MSPFFFITSIAIIDLFLPSYLSSSPLFTVKHLIPSFSCSLCRLCRVPAKWSAQVEHGKDVIIEIDLQYLLDIDAKYIYRF